MLTLTSGASSLVVAPEYGAGITGWMVGRTPILRRALPQVSAGGDVHAMGCFPLLPYANRVGHARFAWHGREYSLKRNFGDRPHSIHGLGWQRAWSVQQATTRSIALTLAHQPDASWPFAFDASIAYSLSGTALTVTMRLTNRHDSPAPAGLGLHPYFPRAHNSMLRFDATGAWENDADSLPLRHDAPPEDWRHDRPRSVGRSRLDNCFTGWSGKADIFAGPISSRSHFAKAGGIFYRHDAGEDSGIERHNENFCPASLRIEASGAFRNLQVFTPRGADFFCVEPVSHMPDALNRAGLPPDQAMHVLRCGETLDGTIRFSAAGDY